MAHKFRSLISNKVSIASTRFPSESSFFDCETQTYHFIPEPCRDSVELEDKSGLKDEEKNSAENKVIQALGHISIGGEGLRSSTVIPCIQVSQKGGLLPEFRVSLKKLQEHGVISSTAVGRKSLLNCAVSLVENFDTDKTVTGIYLIEDKADVKVNFKVDFNSFVADVLGLINSKPNSFWKSSPLINLLPEERVIADFSSPNIAKPFHVGHLRSTILGNFICNLHEAFGHRVTRINYLGDWGTQFGILKYGFDAQNMSDKDLEEDAIRKLYEVYVWANKKAEEDPAVLSTAQEIFSKMEQSDKTILKSWELFRNVTIKDLQQTYSRLNVTFNEYHGESMYCASKCESVVQMMEDKGLLETLEDGRKVFHLNPKEKITVVKSDGTSIYLLRDIVGAIDRYNRYNFSRSYYVVDNAQTNHFIALFDILNQLGYNWSANMLHIKFGRILGMSTRKGTAVFLQDLLDEAQRVMKEKQKETETTPEGVLFDGSDIANEVAVSSIIIGDLKQRRHRDYTFSWEKALKSKGDTGVKLQYVHCRLKSLEENCGYELSHPVNTKFLTEGSAINLVCEIARFDEILRESYKDLEPCVLVNYLFRLSGNINAAVKHLQVKSSPPEVATARLALFLAARYTLAAGMKILGLQPLDNM